MTELLAPAGDLICAKTALYNGADAIYCASEAFGARAYAKNLNLDERVFDRRSIVFKFILRSLYTMYIIPLFSCQIFKKSVVFCGITWYNIIKAVFL